MLLYSKKLFRKYSLNINLSNCSHLTKIIKRKEKLSPREMYFYWTDIRAFLFAPFRGTLTVEAAMVLPFFLFVMISVLQYGTVMETAVKFGIALTDTGKSMAAAAYAVKYGGNTEGIPEIAAGALSAAYAHTKVTEKAGKSAAVKNANMALSSFLQKDEMIDLVLTYQIQSPVRIVPLPNVFFIQKAKIRAWTGRVLPGENGESEGNSKDFDYVYVAENGVVYHDDPDCTHLSLSIRAVDIEALDTLRNSDGSIYHKCERCTGGYISSTVYITEDGNRYHSSLGCSGLKRTVREVHREEAGNMKACSKCGKD